MLLSEGQMSDYKGAALMIDAFPKATAKAAATRAMMPTGSARPSPSAGITPCIPSKANRKVQIDYDKTLYRQRHKIENMFGRLKDWRRASTPATTDAPTPSCPQSASPPPSSSGYDQ